jgi:23S rRNA (uracil1939-C5)-methyltransferase
MHALFIHFIYSSVHCSWTTERWLQLDTVEAHQFLTEIKGYSHAGEGVGDYLGKPVFIPMAARGDVVRFSISEEKKNYAKGCLIEVCGAGPGRTDAPCPDFRHCGGCQLQHLTYEEQLYFKKQTVVDALQRIGRLETTLAQDMLPMDNPWRYRHTVRLHAQHSPQGTALGNYRSKSHSVCHLTACPLLPVEFPAILADVSKLFDTYGGGRPLKEVVVRKGRATEEILLLLKTEDLSQTRTRAIWNELHTRYQNLIGITVQNDGAATGHGGATAIGQNFYSEAISGIRFHIPPSAFFQNNPKQTEVLLRQVRALCEPAPSEHLLDLYCGVGLFTHYLARDYKLVTGIEENSIAVSAARENAAINSNTNTVFIAGRVENTLAQIARSVPAPDTVILDPPRQGCLPGAIAGIAALSPKKIVYISCNPATLARDLALFVKHAYRVQVVQPIDMFPSTYHIECVAKIEKR